MQRLIPRSIQIDRGADDQQPISATVRGVTCAFTARRRLCNPHADHENDTATIALCPRREVRSQTG